MGLGPPVCLDCLEIMTLENGKPPWKCGFCGKEIDKVRNANLLEISGEIEKLYKAIEEFRNISKGSGK
ncbi:MAG: hypothetical protein P8X74_03655 [Reinekea sp.]